MATVNGVLGSMVNMSLEREKWGRKAGGCSHVSIFIMTLKAMIGSVMLFEMIILTTTWRGVAGGSK